MVVPVATVVLVLSVGVLVVVLVPDVVGAGPAPGHRVLAARLRRAPHRVGAVVGERLPEGWRRGLAARLVAAGVDPATGLDAAVGLHCLSAAVGALVIGAVAAMGSGPPVVALGVGVAAIVAAAPEVRLRRRTDRRRRAMARDLPRILDLLVISVEAGLGLDQALVRVVGAVPGPLADEFARMLTEVGAGVPRADALRSLAARCPLPALRSFALAMVQADAYGVSVGPLLRSQAEDIRVRHRQAAQMQAQKAPVKLLIPMVLCIFPALLVVVAGPALLSVRVLIAG